MSKLQFTADVQLQAADGKQPQVSILAYTGGVMNVPGFGPVVIDLTGMELSSIPLLADHDNKISSIAGSGTPEVRNGELHVTGRLAAGTAAGDSILALHRSGVALQASVGAEPVERKYIDGGKSVSVNEKNIVAPSGGFTLVRRSTLREVSLVAMGADRHTSVSIAAKRNKGFQMKDNSFSEWMEQVNTTPPDELTPAELATLHANYQGRSNATDSDRTAVVPYIAASADPVAAEELRLRQIDRITSGDWGEQSEQVATLRANAIAADLTIDQLLEGMRPVRIEQMNAKLPNALLPTTITHGKTADK